MTGVNYYCNVHYYIQQQNTSIASEPFLSTSAPAVKRLMTAHSGRVWGKTQVQSVLKHTCQSSYSGRGLRPCDVTQRSARFQKGVKITKKHWVDLYHYRVAVYTHCQHTFQFKQLVHVALYDSLIIQRYLLERTGSAMERVHVKGSSWNHQ